jgi:hypothetical protein
VDLLIDPDEIPSIFLETTHTDVASDGEHEPSSGLSTFGWVIAADKEHSLQKAEAPLKHIHHSPSHLDRRAMVYHQLCFSYKIWKGNSTSH